MYDHIVGEVIDKHGVRAVLRAAGVGFELKVSMTTAAELKVGEQQRLFTILHVVDGSPTLLGFATRAERELARRILGVSGVGPSIALAVLSTYPPADVVEAVRSNDVPALKAVKGVGQKTAERLCLELRDVVGKLDLQELGVPREPTVVLPSPEAQDAIAALVTLGYSEKDATERVRKAREKVPAGTTEELIKAVLAG